MDDILGTVCRELGLRYFTAHSPDVFERDLAAFVARHRLDVVAFTNAQYAYLAPLPDYRAFHLIRDPRDVAVSAYFSHRYSHQVDDRWPALRERRALLERLPKDEGLLAEIRQLQWDIQQMREWDYGNPRILELRMEDVTADPYRQMLRAFRFLDLVDERRLQLSRRLAVTLNKGVRTLEGLLRTPRLVPFAPARLPAERLLGILWEHDFSRKAGGREPGQEDATSHYRRGVPGDWRNHFTPAHVACFKTVAGDALERLGYEQDASWG